MSTNKRPAPSSFSASTAPTKRAAPAAGTLGAYFPSKTGPARPPSPVIASDPITDRASTFVAHAAPCTNRVQATTLQAHVRALRNASHPVECSHEVLGWRCMGLKPGRTGVDSEDDWRVEGGADDDGEKGAGAVVKEVLEKEGGVDCAIVVSRLYGGIMLGPARFTHIGTVASQALSRLLVAQRLSSLQSQLRTLDAAIAALSPATDSSPIKPAQAQAAAYAAFSVDKAERLVAAREKRLELLERKRREEEEALWRTVEGEGGAGVGGGAEEEEGDRANDPTAAIVAAGEGAALLGGDDGAGPDGAPVGAEGPSESGGGFLPPEE